MTSSHIWLQDTN